MDNVLFLNNLPRFRGNLRPNERESSTPFIDVKIFLRSIDNYLTQNNITNNEQKVRILFGQIDQTSGDAVDLFNCYSGRNPRYEAVIDDFISMYPTFNRILFRPSAQNLLSIRVQEPNVFCGMTRLENSARAVVEAYFKKPGMEDLNILEDTLLELGDGGPQITCRRLLQNYTMHLLLATQLDPKTYEKIMINPDTASTRFMSRVVEQTEKEKLERNEIRRSHNYRANHNNQSEVLFQLQGGAQQGHELKDCFKKKKCPLCGIVGHEAAYCRKRTGNSSRDNSGNQQSRSRNENVRMIDGDDPDIEYNEGAESDY